MNLPRITDVISSHGIVPEKKLGQNFIVDVNLTDQIVFAIGDIKDQVILEIGPGPGSLTRSLLASNAKKVIAIEADERCFKALLELQDAYKGRLELIKGDALRVDESRLNNGQMVIVANLPYNIGTALVLKWISLPGLFLSINVMLQKEVVDRLCAQPSTSDYGRLSIITQWLCDVQKLMMVDPENFYPAPKVISCMVRLTPLASPRYKCNQSALERVTAKAFAQRRKMLRSSLRGLLDEAQIISQGVDPTKRAEDLTVEQFCKLANLL